MASTSDCKKFLLEQVALGNIDASWAYDRDYIEDIVSYNYEDTIDEMSDSEYERLIAEEMKKRSAEVAKALSNEKNWKRRSKFSGEGSVRTIREFMCDTPDGLFDGQVGYEVLELHDGSLKLGENIGD